MRGLQLVEQVVDPLGSLAGLSRERAQQTEFLFDLLKEKRG